MVLAQTRWGTLTLFLTLLVAAQGASARELTVQEKLSDLDQLVSLIKSSYGPFQYKAETQGVDINALRESYAEKIRATTTNGQFYYLISQFVPEFKDSHFGLSIPTFRGGSLPFSADLVDGKVLIEAVDRRRLAEGEFPFVRGDEILEFDGRPVADVVTELQKYTNAGYELTARRRATMRLTVRSGQIMPVPGPGTPVTLKIRHETSSIVETVTLKWQVSGEGFDEFSAYGGLGSVVTRRPDYKMLSTSAMWAEFEPYRSESSYRCSGGTRVTIPQDATIIMTSPFVAYYHPTAKGNIGYLRIPHYYPQNEQTGAFEFELRLKQYEYAISVLEKNTVGLIIDQDHNCGGSVDYLHAVVGLFADKPFQPMQFQLLATKEQYLDMKRWLDGINPLTLEYQNAKATAELVRDSWLKGEPMTPKTALDGEKLIAPRSIRYTKPIVMLIDELSGSGGDAFPALMQGIGRAKLLGTRTMGAGGHVVEAPPLYYSQIKVRLTKSLFFRPDGVAVENNGAVPDYPYTITRDDFTYGYKNYQAFYLSKLLELL